MLITCLFSLGCVCAGMLLACVRKLEVCILIQLAHVHRPMYAHTYSCPKTLIQVLCFHSLLFYIICLSFNLLVCF